MKAEPPYLLGHHQPRPDRSITVTADVRAGVVEVAVRGRWDRPLWHDAAATLHKCLAEHPEALLLDLHDLDDPQAQSASAWWTTGMRGADMRPPVSVLLCLPAQATLAARLRRLGARRSLPVLATMEQARAAAASGLPLTDRQQVRLAPEPEAASLAGNLVADACQAWRLPQLLHPARRVMSELVLNAVEHAGTDMLVTVSRRGTGIHLAVSDGDARLPRLREPAPAHRAAPLDERGRGLRAVHAATTVWGAMPTTTGKVVWAVMHPGQAPRR